jgi:hypothetical protein
LSRKSGRHDRLAGWGKKRREAEGAEAPSDDPPTAVKDRKKEEGPGVEAGPGRGGGFKGRPARQALITAAAFVMGALLALSVVRWDRVEDVLRRADRGISGLWHQDSAETGDNRPFLVNPLTGQRFKDGEINTAVAVVGGDGMLSRVAYISWSEGDGALEVFLLPPELVGKASGGEDLSLAASMRGHADNPVDFRYLVESITSRPLHYVLSLPLERLPALGEALELPPIEVQEDCEMFNPFTGAVERMRKGMVVRDRDRILAYLLAAGSPAGYRESTRRCIPYLPLAAEALREREEGELAGALSGTAGSFSLYPSPADDRERSAYLASLILAWSDGGGIKAFGAPRIEVLNGCGVVGAGMAFKTRLEERGYRVDDATRNAKKEGEDTNDFSYQASVVFVGGDDPLLEAYARYLALMFKIPRVQFKQEVDGLVIVVGSDLAAAL